MAPDERPEVDRAPGYLMDLGVVTGRSEDRPDLIEIGSSATHGGGFARHRLIRWLPAALAVALVAAVVVHHNNSESNPAAHPSSVPSVISPRGGESPATGTPQPVVTQYFDHPFLGLYSTWELYGLGPTNVVRIEFAKARLTRTEFPSLNSGGPVSFAVDRAGAIVRPLDHVTGYRVPDTQPAKLLDNALGLTGPALPGPDGNTYWVPISDGNQDVMMLVDDAGNKLGPSVKIPSTMSPLPESDGTGYLILTDETGSYDARPNGLKRITEGGLLAVGARQWLVSECDDRHHCVRVVIDRQTGKRRVFDHAEPEPTPAIGAISPDGHYAAVLEFDQKAHFAVHLLDLTTGKDHALGIQVADDAPSNSLAWSPDSQWLFAVGAAGDLLPIHPNTGEVQLLGVPVPPLKQLVIRSSNS